MGLTAEAELVQNSTLGALALWAFANEFSAERDHREGPEFALTTLVLPVVFHEETLNSIYGRHFDGGLFTALGKNPALVVELQDRVEAMTPQTMTALNVSFASGLLTFDRTRGQLRTLRRTPPFQPEYDTTRHVISASERLGYWCSTIATPQLCSLINVRF